MSVHYKFKSNLEHDTVTFDGLNISVADLKKSIMHQKKIGKSSDFDLQITNAQTKEVYDNDEILVPKNTSVIVARVPAAGGKQKNWDKPDLPLPIDDDDLGKIRYDRIAKSADLANANISEEDKVKSMIIQSSQEYDPSNHAYKQVKKEKPPFVPQEEPVAEPEAQIPEELLCMVCKDLLQDAVLIPCCGNSFCDECVRQVLLESDNHECPECHETDVSPNTLIPNRFLRTAVLNFKNETGYTRVKKVYQPAKFSPMHMENVESPQPSPDSTVENHPQHAENNSLSQNSKPQVDVKVIDESKVVPSKIEIKIEPAPVPLGMAEEVVKSATPRNTPVHSPKPSLDEDSQDVQPGTPLADEPEGDLDHPSLPIHALGQDQYHSEKYDHRPGHRYHRGYRDDYRSDRPESNEPKSISTIETITNMRNKMNPTFFGRPAPVRQQFSNRPVVREERTDERFNRDREDYHNRDFRRRNDRGGSQRQGHHSRYDRSPSSRYHEENYHANKEHTSTHIDATYDSNSHDEEPSRRHGDRYRAPPPPPVVHIAPPIVPVYAPPPIPIQPIVAAPQVFAAAAQPPPPGASPVVDVAAQPPPPGVGPLLPPTVSTETPAFTKETEKVDNRTIEDKMEAFQRDLEKRDRAYSRDRDSTRSRSRSSSVRERSRSSSRSRSYTNSKSWSRSVSRSISRSSRSRSRTLSSRSRSRSFTPSRSRSWSKARSYSRSRSRTRTESRSRSRSRTEPRFRKRAISRERERVRSPRPPPRSPRHRSRSRSYTPKNYNRPSNHHRNVPFSGRHFTPPQYGGGAYQSHFAPPPAVPIPVLRPEYPPPHHVHPIHPVSHPFHSRPIEHYPVERPPKCPPYTEMYPMYDMHQHPRYDREQRPPRYEKRLDYQKDYQRPHPEIIGHRIPGYIGDRSRDYKPGYRRGGPRKELIRELPHIDEQQMRVYQKEQIEDTTSSKKKEDKVSIKHKKHHHHRKDSSKRQDIKTSTEKHVESSKTIVKVEKQVEKPVVTKSRSESSRVTKNTEKAKEKKHKHKKHKIGEPGVKKKKTSKKEKGDGVQTTDSDVKVKRKKKRVKVVAENNSATTVKVEKVDVPPETVVKTEVIKTEEVQDTQVKETEVSADTLDLFADEGEATLLASEQVLETVKKEVEDNAAIENEEAAVENEEIGVEKAEEEEEMVEEEEEEVNSEEEIEEEVVEEGLHVDLPALSKWEREEMEEDMELRSQRKSNLDVPKEEKESLSSDIIHRAELAILSKPYKPQLASKEKGESKDSSVASSPEVPAKLKEVELKSVVNTERLSPAIQVTIPGSKEKRLTIIKKEDKSSRDQTEGQSSRHIKLERSSHRSRESSRRVVSRSDRVRDSRDRNLERHERRRSPIREITIKPRIPHDSRERRDTRRLERDSRYDDERLKEERKRRFAAETRNIHSAWDYGDSMRSERRRPTQDAPQHSRSVRIRDQDHIDRVKRPGSSHISRSQSLESSESHNSQKRKEKEHTRKGHAEESQRSSKDYHESNSSKIRMKHSPVKPPEKHNLESKRVKRDSLQDELKFEPDYEDYSEDEEEIKERQKLKRKSASPDTSRKRARVERVTESSGKDVTSSASSSANSDSDSSDSDEPKSSKTKASDSDHKQRHKKSKHKKHKKHKHKHKKRKSHKSKRE